MRNLFISLTCIVLFALSASTVTAQFDGGIVVIFERANLAENYELPSVVSLATMRSVDNLVKITAIDKEGVAVTLYLDLYMEGQTIIIGNVDNLLTLDKKYTLLIEWNNILLDSKVFTY